MKWLYCAVCLTLITCSIGCSSSPYEDGYAYVPYPVVADIPATQPTQPPPVRASASIVGIRTEDKKAGLPESIEVRFSVDDYGTDAITFDPGSLELRTGDLVRFPPPILQSPAPVTIMPGEAAFATAYFPFPGGKSSDDFNLETLQLRWGLQIGPQRVEQIADFQRAYQRVYYYREDPYYWGPYPYRPGPYYGGVVVIHRR
jgi:hypothetical protein